MEVKIASEQEWISFVERTKCATFFHTIDWYKTWEKYAGYSHQSYLIRFRSGHQVLLPVAYKKIAKGFLKEYQSSPAGTYGGFLTDDPLSKTELSLLEKWLMGFITIELTYNPFSSISAVLPSQREDFTQVILLTEDWGDIEKRMKHGHILRKVRKADRNHLTLRKLKFEEIGLFYQIYISRRNDWKMPTNDYKQDIFEYLFQFNNVDFWGVYLADNTLICGGVFVRHHHHMASWLPIAMTQYLPINPYEFLFYNLIRHYKSEGLKWFDFNPSGGHKGVVRFKAGFGAIKKEVFNYSYQGKIIDCLSAINRLKKRLI